MALPSRTFASRRRFITRRIPPALSMSTAVYLPQGFMSARSGVRALIRSKSSSVNGTFASRATARRWSTEFVDPPVAMTARIAFSRAGRVLADGFIDAAGRDVLALEAARHDRAAVDHEAGNIHARECHDSAGDRLVAAADADKRVEEMSACDELDGVGDDFA